ncbi:sperm receptor for egg jelly-like [Ptychodera flava]|uniref:sperm receptor for egg jelly-like n=1 Tax=Ptychodera flava TaxID=63121 RepID=UPI00396A9CFD
MDTKFIISCRGFNSEEKPLSYEYYSSTHDPSNSNPGALDDMAHQLLYYSPDGVTPELSLPMGRADTDYLVTIQVDVIDAIGAKVSDYLQVQVLPPTESKLESVLDSFKVNEANELDALLDKGDIQAAVQYVSVLTAALNNEDITSKTDGLGTESPLTEEKLEQKKAIRKEVRSALVNKIATVKVRNLEIMKETSSALSQVVEKDVTPDAQLTASMAFDGMTNILKEQSKEVASPEDVEEVARHLLTGVSKLMKAASDDATDFFEELEMDSDAWNEFMMARQSALVAMLPVIAIPSPTPTADILIKPEPRHHKASIQSPG